MKQTYLGLVAAALVLLAQGANGQVFFVASLDGSQETPPVSTPAQATAWAVLSPDMTTLTYGVTYAQLSAAFTVSHFHIGAPGVGGGVVHGITYAGNSAGGAWTGLPDSIIGALLEGNIYLNIHSSAHPGGEIRGQLIPAQGIGFRASMDGAQETPPTGSLATGTGWAVLDSSGARVTYRVTVAGLDTTITVAHFHDGAPGVGGGVVHGITFVDSTSSGVWSGVPQNLAIELMKGNLYFNVHTPVNQGGAIRGQLTLASAVVFTASLDGSQETPPVSTTSRGTAWALLSPDVMTLTYGVTYAGLSSAFTASHFHVGPVGTGGGVVHGITYVGNTAGGSWSALPDSIIGDLIAGNVYVNVHSSLHQGGEIRGQLLPAQGVGFHATLTGDQETPPTGSAATGTGWSVLDSNGARLTYQVTVAGLDTPITVAHFHDSPPGIGGGVVHGIDFADSTSVGVWSGIPENVMIDLMKGNLYVNVHTPVFPGGAIRGQVECGPNTLTAVVETGSRVPAAFALEQNYPNPFNPSTKIRFTLPAAAFVSLRVYDVLGREVASLVNSTIEPGQHVVTFDGTALASGVYFYRMRVAGVAPGSGSALSGVVKMLLVK